MPNTNLSRRTALSFMLGTGFSAFAAEAEVVAARMTGVKTLKDLVEAVKLAAGPRRPSRFKVKDVYRAFASAFVENGQEAIRQGIKIPRWIAEKLPGMRKAMVPAMVLIPLWGLIFLVPLAPFFWIILGSLTVLSLYIVDEISDRSKGVRRASVDSIFLETLDGRELVRTRGFSKSIA